MDVVGVELRYVVGASLVDETDEVTVGVSVPITAAPTGGEGSTDAADILITDTGSYYTGTDVEAALQEAGVIDANQDTWIQGVSDSLDAHTGDTAGAHAASAISFAPNGSIAATDVQAAIQEVRDEAGTGSVSDTAYNATSWDGVTGVAPSKNAVRDKIEALDAAKANIASPTFTGAVTIPSGASITAPTGLVKGDVGLGSVDNTADTAKPVSTAQQTAIDAKVSDTAYGSGWDGVTTVAPSKNAVYDKIESLGSASISDTAYAGSWDGVTTIAPSKNAVYDQMELRAPKASPTFTGTVTIPSGAALGTPASVNLSNATSLADAALAATGTAGTYGSASAIPVITTDAKGRVTSVTTASPTTRPPAIAKILARQQLR